ncbi:M20/M25/M40 family metallo-hydrolase [Pseudarthrobacter sp. So.54]
MTIHPSSTAAAPHLPTVFVPPIDAAELCARLIRFDTTNHGEGKSAGERECAEFIAALLESAGYRPVLLAPSPERASVVVRIEGTDRSLPGLLVHAHLDVVPAEPEQWSRDPFSGEIDDGYIYGRGASDMKDMVAMTLATLLNWSAAGIRPLRDIVVAFVADEEDKGDYGALWLAADHPELFAGCRGRHRRIRRPRDRPHRRRWRLRPAVPRGGRGTRDPAHPGPRRGELRPRLPPGACECRQDPDLRARPGR